MMQGRQGMGQQMGQMGQQMGQGMGQGSGESGGLGAQLQAQIQQMKQELGYGGYMQKQGGQASSGWGLGTSPHAVSPAPADPTNQVEDRQGDDSLGDTAPVEFDPLYAPEDVAHSFTSESQLHGQFDPTASPQKIEEVRSAPEDQASLIEYAEVIGAYTEGEESAIAREQVPLEYQELVREYFERLNQQSSGSSTEPSASDDSASTEDDSGEGEADPESGGDENDDSSG